MHRLKVSDTHSCRNLAVGSGVATVVFVGGGPIVFRLAHTNKSLIPKDTKYRNRLATIIKDFIN